MGNVKNINKNPVAERAIEELGLECLHLYPEGGSLSKVTLALATANLNSRIRQSGLSARELWTQRDQLTCEQLPIQDRQIILQQHMARTHNHLFSAKSKANGQTQNAGHNIKVGDLVFLYADRDKTRARDKYIVTSVSGTQCQIRKFTKTQFRSKVYDVKIGDCYPVISNALAQSPPGPIRGLDLHDIPESDSDSDTDSNHGLPPDYQPSVLLPASPVMELQPALPPDIVMPPVRDSLAPATVDICSRTDPLSRPLHTHKAPSWQQSGDWMMN